MNEEFKVLAERYEMKEDQVRKIVPAEELALALCVEKAIKFVRDNAKVTEISAAEAAAKEEAPKKKRTTKKKAEEAEAPAAEGEEAPAPKKRATRIKKTEEIDPSVD